uniref:Uncharacterized protein n=1 Tax=Arundo donax TaxID=35708 RepID=A0A0A9E8A0_ARUDO
MSCKPSHGRSPVMCINNLVSGFPNIESQVGIVILDSTSTADPWLTVDISPFSTRGCTPSKAGTFPVSVIDSNLSEVVLDSSLWRSLAYPLMSNSSRGMLESNTFSVVRSRNVKRSITLQNNSSTWQ